MYNAHVKAECEALRTERSFSLTWAVCEARILLSGLTGSSRTSLTNEETFLRSAKQLPLFLVEKEAWQAEGDVWTELAGENCFWTVEGSFFDSAEDLIREVDSGSSLSGVIDALKVAGLLPSELILCGASWRNALSNQALREWEVDSIRIDRKHRRADLSCARNPRQIELRWHYLTHNLVSEAVYEQFVARASSRELLGRVLSSGDTALMFRRMLVRHAKRRGRRAGR